MLTTSVLIQVSQLPGLDAAAFEAVIKVFSSDADREPHGGEPAIADHPVDSVRMQVRYLAAASASNHSASLAIGTEA